jgi:uncharacterized membrane protein YgcG
MGWKEKTRMFASFNNVFSVTCLLFSQMFGSMDVVRVATETHPASGHAMEIADPADVFSRGAEFGALEELQRTHRTHRTSVRIETIMSLDGAWIADVAAQRSRMGRSDQLYILVAEGEHDVGVIAAGKGPTSRLTDQDREVIRRAFLGPFRSGNADEALAQGVRAIGTAFDGATPGLRFNARDALVFAAILPVVLAALLISPIRSWYEERSSRHLRTAGAIACGHVGDSSPTGIEQSRDLQLTLNPEIPGPMRTGPSAHFRQKVKC